MSAIDPDTTRAQVLDAADVLFNAHGVRAVGMQDIRDASGVPLNRLYRTYPSKDSLVAAYLTHRDQVARAALRAHLDTQPADPHVRILAVFDWLGDHVAQPNFRGCVFTTTHSELGTDSPAAPIITAHKNAIRAMLTDLAGATTAPDPPALGAQLHVLFDGVLTLSAITGERVYADQARAVVQALLAGLPAAAPN